MKRIFVLIVTAGLFFAASVFGADTTSQFRTLKTVNTMKAAQFKSVTAIKIKKQFMLKAVLRPIVPTTTVKPEGPDPQAAIDLSDMIDDADLLEDLEVTCGWDPHLIFQDKAAGNVFYYLPRGFVLVYDESNGYGLNVQYNHLKDEEKPSVMIMAQLAAPHHKGDILLLKSILKQAFDLKASDKLTLKSISGIGASADLQAISAGLSIPAEQISLTMPSHLKKSFRLILSLNPDETEEVLAQISREGLVGSLNVKVGDASVPIPIHLQYFNFAGDLVDGFHQWVDNKPVGQLRNTSLFPVKVDSINCYKVKGGQLERISKRIKPSIILPGRKKNFKLPPVNKVLGTNVMLAWLGTSLDPNCDACIKKVDKQVRKGVATAASSHIKFEVIPIVFSDFDLYKIIVQVQSPYFSAEPGDVSIQEIELTEEANIQNDLVIYIPEGKGSEPLLYRYRLKLITSDGNSLLTNNWSDSRSLSQFFGPNHIEPIMGDNGPDTEDVE